MTNLWSRSLRVSLAASAIFTLAATPQLQAHSVREQTSFYNDNQGISRERYKAEGNVALTHERTITGSTYTVNGSRENYYKDDISDDEYSQKYYEGGERHTDSVSVGAGQTWRKLTDTRVLGAFSKDEAMTSRTFGAGASHWFFHENLQVGADVSRTQVDQPVFEYVDRDSDIISPPPVVSSTGTTLSVKHLANPTTVLNYALSHVETTDRPPSNTYIVGVKQYIPKTKSAVHFDVARAINRGRITTKTSYGQVDAWIVETAFLQSLWRGASTRLAYRYYQEDEVTRATEDEYQRGSDLISLNLSQELDRKIIDSLRYPLTVEGGMAHYETNRLLEDGGRVIARIYEMGLVAKF